MFVIANVAFSAETTADKTSFVKQQSVERNVKEKQELKAVNQKIKKLRSKESSERVSKEIVKLNAQKVEIKAKHNEIFESYLTDEQKVKLQQMRENKKKGISCCHCRRNSYY